MAAPGPGPLSPQSTIHTGSQVVPPPLDATQPQQQEEAPAPPVVTNHPVEHIIKKMSFFFTL